MVKDIAVTKKESPKDIFTLGEEGRSIIVRIFKGKEIRFRHEGDEVLTPLVDIYKAAGLNKAVANKIFHKIGDESPDLIWVSTMDTWGEMSPNLKNRKVLAFKGKGVAKFFTMVRSDEIKNPETRQNIKDLQDWTLDLIEGALTGETERATIQRLKDAGYPAFDEWGEQRSFSKMSNLMLNATLKRVMEGKYGVGKVPRQIYPNEARMINKLSFDEHYKGIRDDKDLKDLVLLSVNLISDHAYLIEGHTEYHDRKELLGKVTECFHEIAQRKSLPKPKNKQRSLDSFL